MLESDVLNRSAFFVTKLGMVVHDRSVMRKKKKKKKKKKREREGGKESKKSGNVTSSSVS